MSARCAAARSCNVLTYALYGARELRLSFEMCRRSMRKQRHAMRSAEDCWLRPRCFGVTMTCVTDAGWSLSHLLHLPLRELSVPL